MWPDKAGRKDKLHQYDWNLFAANINNNNQVDVMDAGRPQGIQIWKNWLNKIDEQF